MKPCAYRWEIIGDVVECGNTVNLYHNGTVPVSVCEICPYQKQPDYTTANSRLYTLQQSQGVYVPRPRTCGGCGTVKRRADVLQFVWPYSTFPSETDRMR